MTVCHVGFRRKTSSCTFQLAYPPEPIHQHLICIGKERLTMPDFFTAPAFTYRYSLLDRHTVDCSILLTQDTPDALICNRTLKRLNITPIDITWLPPMVGGCATVWNAADKKALNKVNSKKPKK